MPFVYICAELLLLYFSHHTLNNNKRFSVSKQFAGFVYAVYAKCVHRSNNHWTIMRDESLRYVFGVVRNIVNFIAV